MFLFKKNIFIFLFALNVFNANSMNINQSYEKKYLLSSGISLFDDKDVLNNFKNVIRSLSLSISTSLFLNPNKQESARSDIYGIFFDILKENYEQIMNRVFDGDAKEIEILSRQLLSTIYIDCENFINEYEFSNDYIIQETIKDINLIIKAIKFNEKDVLEKIRLVLMDFRKEPLLERIGYYVDKIRKGVAYGSGVILALSMPALIGGTKNAFTFTIIEYSGGVFICTTIVPKLLKKISSLLD